MENYFNYIKLFIAVIFGARHVFSVMGFLGLSLVYLMRVNLSVAIVDMINSTTPLSPISEPSFFSINESETCPNDNEQGGENVSFKKNNRIINVMLNTTFL